MGKYCKIDNLEIVGSLFNLSTEPMPDCPEYAEDVELVMGDGKTLAGRFFLAGKEAPTLLYFPDSMVPDKKYDITGSNYIRHDINFLLTSYRGLGKNRGKPGIASMLEDANHILHETILFLKRKKHEGPLFVMGTSLGSACVIDLAYNFPGNIKGMLIESGFCDTIPFLNGLGLDTTQLDLTENDGFNNREKIEKIQLPTLIMHGSGDDLVPPAQAEILQASSGARNKQFHIVPGADRTTVSETGGDLYFRTIKTFIDTVSGINTWRQRRRNYHK